MLLVTFNFKKYLASKGPAIAFCIRHVLYGCYHNIEVRGNFPGSLHFYWKFYHYDCFLDSPIQVKANVFSSYQLGCCGSARWTDTSGYGSPTHSTNHFSRHIGLLSGCIFGRIFTFSRFHLTGTSLCIDLPSSTSSNKHHCLHQHYHNRVVDCSNLGCILSVSCVRHLRIQILHWSLLCYCFYWFGYYLLVLRGNPS